jgi:hypothetical protein
MKRQDKNETHGDHATVNNVSGRIITITKNGTRIESGKGLKINETDGDQINRR